MTFTIVGRCSNSGQFGVAVTSSSIAVGSRCPWVRAGVGAVASQNVTDPRLGNEILDLMQSGFEADVAVNLVTGAREFIEYRQLLCIDAEGRAGHFSGSNILGRHAACEGRDAVAGGNMLADETVPSAMIVAFEAAGDKPLAERLLAALDAGEKTGGEEGTIHSAAVLVSGSEAWPYVDLRIDWHGDAPLDILRGLWQAYEPQASDYVARALNPEMAPSYGVPGDP